MLCGEKKKNASGVFIAEELALFLFKTCVWIYFPQTKSCMYCMRKNMSSHFLVIHRSHFTNTQAASFLKQWLIRDHAALYKYKVCDIKIEQCLKALYLTRKVQCKFHPSHKLPFLNAGKIALTCNEYLPRNINLHEPIRVSCALPTVHFNYICTFQSNFSLFLPSHIITYAGWLLD